MTDRRASLEVIAATVDEALQKGLGELGLREDDVEMEVLDAGSRGLFGLGARQARIRLTIKSTAQMAYTSADPVERGPEREMTPYNMPDPDAAVTPPTPPVVTPPPAPVERAAPKERPAPAERQAPTPVVAAPEVEAEPMVLDEDQENALRVAQEIVSELLQKMKVTNASITAHYGEPDEPHSRQPLMVDVRGNDLSILIGPRAETLNALQYISSLMISKELGHSVPLVVDVEGYRARREQAIRQLARRMAEQAIKTGHRQVLEPMPASERRLIHIELRNNPDVSTESVGEEPRRKVTIVPK